MVRAEVVSTGQQISANLPYPTFEYDYEGVELHISPPFKADTTRSSCFAELPSGKIMEGISRAKPGKNKLIYTFPVEVGGTYTFHNRTISNNGQWANREVWRWEVPNPGGFELSANYPNPFNPETTVPFELLEAANVQVAIYDILGRKVKTLPQRNYDAGPQSIRIDLNGHASGMYLIRMSVTRPNGRGAASQSQKVMLIK